ncbi:unnamed protein product [Blepharisma stoltei]|uniref:Uncharacterized protein n=1 Tax=Blepharisma stoltei TaxID=1481888 RepID=A0AAU9J7Q0_9CILI|nr:unnamed protein product [Blepharisma stoltei]
MLSVCKEFRISYESYLSCDCCGFQGQKIRTELSSLLEFCIDSDIKEFKEFHQFFNFIDLEIHFSNVHIVKA